MSLIENGLPRTSLDRALAVPKAICLEDRSLTRDEVAVALGVKPGTGSANSRTIAARKFGLIRRDPKGGYSITDLGRRLAAAPDDVELRRRAILGVRLFRQVKDHFETDPGEVSRDDLARAMVALGVGRERAVEAAAVFDRSWSQAPRRGGLVPPGGSGDLAPVEKAPGRPGDQSLSPATRDVPGHAGLVEHPLVAAVLAHAPVGDAGWDAARRDAWLDLFASAVRFVHPS